MELRFDLQADCLTVFLTGRLDGNTAPQLETELKPKLANVQALVLDFAELTYVSSAGLRVILSAQKAMQHQKGSMLVRGVNTEVMEVLELTGFSEILTIEKAVTYKEIQPDTLHKIAAGATGAVYTHSDDSIVKLYTGHGALETIEKEKKYAREAFVLGIPTAISLHIVKVGEQFGLEYEFIKSRNLSQEITASPAQADAYSRMLCQLAQTLHSTSHQTGNKASIFESTQDVFLHHISINPYFTPEEKELCSRFVSDIPARDTLRHGDFHPGNIMLSDGEPLLIDIADISYGHPIYDLAGTFFTLFTVSTFTRSINDKGLTVVGLFPEQSRVLWDKFIDEYLAFLPIEAAKQQAIQQIILLAKVRYICLGTMHGRARGEAEVANTYRIIKEEIMPNIGTCPQIDW